MVVLKLEKNLILNKSLIKFVAFFVATNSAYCNTQIGTYYKYQLGESSYYVNNENSTNFLESKLIFPIESNLVGITLNKRKDSIDIILGYEFQPYNSSQTNNGEDFDWQNEVATVYSKSNNYVTNNKVIFLEVSKQIPINYINNLKFRISHQNLNFEWENTEQTNLITTKTQIIESKTINYSQELNKYGLSIFSNKNNSSFIYNGLINYYDVTSIDEHLMRNMKTISKNSGFGYEYEFGYQRELNKESFISIIFNNEYFKNNGYMKYYLNNIYVVDYPNTIEFKTKNIKFQLVYKF